MAIGSQDLQFNVLTKVFGEQAIKQFQNSIEGLNTSAKKLNGGLSGLTAVAKTLGVAFAVKETAGFIKGLIDTADQLRNVSQATGVSVKDLDNFKAAAEQADVPFESLSTALNKFSKNIVEAKNGNRELIAAFKNLGVSITDSTGKIRPSGELFRSLADRFASLKDGPEKASLAIKLFGKSGADLIPLLNEGAASLQKFGLGFDDNLADRADQFNDSLSQLGNSIKRSGVDGLRALLPTLQDIVNAFQGFGQSDDVKIFFEGVGEAVRLGTLAFEGFRLAFTQGLDAIITAFRLAYNDIKNIGRLVADEFTAIGIRAKTSFLPEAQKEKAREQIRKNDLDRETAFLQERTRLELEYVQRSEKRLTEFDKRRTALIKNSRILGSGSIDEIRANESKSTEAPRRAQALGATPAVKDFGLKEQRDRLEEFLALQSLENQQRRDALNDIGRERGEIAKITETRKIETEIKRLSNTLSAEQRAELDKRIVAIREERLALIEQQEQQRQSYGAGAKQAFRDYVDSATDAASQTRKLFTQAFQNIEDSLTSFVKTGKLDFKKFADDVITELIRIQVRAVIVKTITGIGSLFGGAGGTVGGGAGQSISPNIFAKGGVMSGYGEVPLRSYAEGGIARRPQLALFGENSQAEAFVPLPDGRRIPVALEGGGGGGGTVVNVNVNMETGSSTTESTKEDGRALGGLIAAAVQKELVKQKLPGGILAS